jgi:thioredoxin-like negative regulator of GroEL
MRSCIAWFASIAIALTGAVALAGNGSHPSLVPWKVLEPGAEPEHAPLVLFWIPTSRDELRRSELLMSDELTLFSSHCVAMRIVRLDDYALLERLQVAELPAVVLVRGGEVVGTCDAAHVADVEEMVREELAGRALAAEALLDDARKKAEEGEIEEATALYRQVWEQRCLCPRQGKAAQRALRRLEK